ncbi:MAG: D-glycero-beta-D-manno-heptose-7-phosphate kinase, partial [Deltaproteobacteria bacterium]|nr:D-glycero-beta-D-manno-heptose-7-phosphate kinase [Deltaproteobacteria bacterium]
MSKPPGLSPADLLKRIAAFKQGRVLIVGDLMLDVYLFGDAERISPEAPVPVVRVSGEKRLLGGAGNVARNISSLGGQAVLVSARGQDQAGDCLEDFLAAEGIQAKLVLDRDRETTLKTRLLARGQQMLRFDRETQAPRKRQEEEQILLRAQEELKNCRAVVISDYGKGVITPYLMRHLLLRIRSLPRPIPVLVDPKPQNLAAYEGVTLLTPNVKETGELARLPVGSPAEIAAAGRALMERLGCPHLVTTLGAEGMAVFENRQTIRHIPTMARQVFDVTGAGDTVIATLALALALKAPLLQACMLANFAAGLVVAEIGAAVTTGPALAGQ